MLIKLLIYGKLQQKIDIADKSFLARNDCNIARNELGEVYSFMAGAREAELISKVQGLVQKRFAGNYRSAFDHYGKSGRMDEDGLERLLKDAGVGTLQRVGRGRRR